jgi:hypothetical protein
VAGDGLAIAEAIETRLRTGRLLGTQEWIARQEQALARKLTPAKRGPSHNLASSRIFSIVSPEFRCPRNFDAIPP